MAGKLKRKGKPYDPAGQGNREGMRQGYLHANPPRAQPPSPAPVHDRRSQDLTMGAADHVTIMEVDDPLGLEPGDKVLVIRNLRSDPLAQLHSRGVIDEAAYEAGRSYQRDFERASTSIRAIDPSKEFVDGGLPPVSITDGQMKAVDKLIEADKALGTDGIMIAQEVLVHGLSMRQVAARRGLTGEKWRDYFGKRFRECLETLAVVYGHATKRKIVK